MFDELIKSAVALIEEHNLHVNAKIDSNHFVSNLKLMGGTSVERLVQMSHEDISECFQFSDVTLLGTMKPKLLAKSIASLFRKSKQNNFVAQEDLAPAGITHFSPKKVEKMSVIELIEHFEPDNQNAVWKKLEEYSKGEPFIVYSSGRTVNKEVTIQLLGEIRTGYPGRKDMTVGNEIYKVYKIYELPDFYVDENPLYKGRPLRPDGTCDQLGRSWAGISLEIRQMVYLAVELGEFTLDHQRAHDIMDIVVTPGALDILRTRFRKTALKYTERLKLGTLPKLQVALRIGGSEGKNPFPKGKKVDVDPQKKPHVKPQVIESVYGYPAVYGDGYWTGHAPGGQTHAEWIVRRPEKY